MDELGVPPDQEDGWVLHLVLHVVLTPPGQEGGCRWMVIVCGSRLVWCEVCITTVEKEVCWSCVGCQRMRMWARLV